MPTSETQTGIPLQLPEAMRTAFDVYVTEKAAPIEAVIEMAIANMLAGQSLQLIAARTFTNRRNVRRFLVMNIPSRLTGHCPIPPATGSAG